MGDDEGIRTPFDDLLASLRAAGRKISVYELSLSCRMPQSDVLKWLSILEKSGSVHLENRFNGVYATWKGEAASPKRMKPAVSRDAIDVGAPTQKVPAEQKASALPDFNDGQEKERERKSKLRETHMRIISEADAELAAATDKLLTIDRMLSDYQRKKDELSAKRTVEKAEGGEHAAIGRAKETEAVAKTLPLSKRRAAIIAQYGAEAEGKKTKAAAESEPQAREENETDEPRKAQPVSEDEADALVESKIGESEREVKIPLPIVVPKPEPVEEEAEESPAPERKHAEEGAEWATSAHELARKLPAKVKGKLVPLIKPIARQQGKIARIKKPEPLKVTNVSLQFSEKLARHIRKIVSQAQEIDRLRMEKEKLLTEHYLPMERKLECEIETISDRVLRLQKGILNMQEKASELPARAGEVEKLQIAALKAHAEMRKAYDEAAALIDEAARELNDEREKMELLSEQGREDIATHRSKSGELSRTLERISQMEEEAAGLVSSARAALAEQAERLAAAETHSHELSSLKLEISDGLAQMKREMATAKGVLTNLDKEMGRMRQVEDWAISIRDEYVERMGEIDDFIRNGNHEFETLRDSVEANFVRRYLHELRSLTDSYSFEFSQVKGAEEGIEEKIAIERRKLDQLLDDGRKLAYLYESQSRELPGAEKYERHGAAFEAMEGIAGKRSEVSMMVAQLLGKKVSSFKEPPLDAVQPSAAKKEREKPIFAKKKRLAPKTIDKVHRKKAAKKAPAKKKILPKKTTTIKPKLKPTAKKISIATKKAKMKTRR